MQGFAYTLLTSSGWWQPSHLARPLAPVSPIWYTLPSAESATVRFSPALTCWMLPRLQGPVTLRDRA